MTPLDLVVKLAIEFYGDDRWVLTLNSSDDDDGANRWTTLWHPRHGRSFTSTGTTSRDALVDLALSLRLYIAGHREFVTLQGRP